jgi:hypothetical protein
MASFASTVARAQTGGDANEGIVFLLDVDNTLLDNDQVIADLRSHLEIEFGATSAARYWAIFEGLRRDLGYADYLGALQRYRLDGEIGQGSDQRLLQMSAYLIDYVSPQQRHTGQDQAILAARAVSPGPGAPPGALVGRYQRLVAHRRGDPQSRTRRGGQDGCLRSTYSAQGCVTQATTTLTRAGASSIDEVRMSKRLPDQLDKRTCRGGSEAKRAKIDAWKWSAFSSTRVLGNGGLRLVCRANRRYTVIPVFSSRNNK